LQSPLEAVVFDELELEDVPSFFELQPTTSSIRAATT
jgi:hypothetical protein